MEDFCGIDRAAAEGIISALGKMADMVSAVV